MASNDELDLDTDEEISDNEDGYPADLDDEGALDSDADDGDDRGDELGEADSLESDELDGAYPTGNMPSPPPGYSSWEEAYEAQTRYAAQLEDQQQQAYESYRAAQEAEQRRQVQQQQGFGWQLPHEMTPDMQMALRLRGTEGFDKLPESVRSRADEVASYLGNHWDRWTYNPQSFVQDVVFPQIAPVVQQLTQQLAELKAAEFRRQHQDDLANPDDVQDYLHMVDQASSDPYQASLEFLRMRRALEHYQQAERGHKTKAQDRQAQAKSQRGRPAQAGKTKGRRNKRRRTVEKAKRADPSAIASNVMQDMLAAGELTQADLEG